MVANSQINEPLAWGEHVKLKPDAPVAYQSASDGEIVGFWKIETEIVSRKYKEPIGTAMCTLELSNGASTQVPVKYIMKEKAEFL